MSMQDGLVETLYRYTQAISVALGHRDHETRLHSERVSKLSMALGERCGLSAHELGILHIGASLHDVGKIGIRDAILSKPGQLSDAERSEMNRHSEIGEDIILATGIEGAAEAARVIRHHHEHFDGSGYPDNLAGSAIPLASRIISLTDSYDAMAVTRTYHRQRSHAEIMQVLTKELGSKHDPALFPLFCEIIAHNPLRAA